MAEQNNNQQPSDSLIQTPPTEFVLPVIYRGFAVTITTYGKAEALETLISKLEAMGAEPAPTLSQSQMQTDAAQPRGANDGQPQCPIHNVAMKESRKRGSYFCPKKTRDGYCEETVEA